jgi:hypothetical protein
MWALFNTEHLLAYYGYLWSDLPLLAPTTATSRYLPAQTIDSLRVHLFTVTNEMAHKGYEGKELQVVLAAC